MTTSVEQRWECPNCTVTARSYKVNGTPFHPCKGLKGLSAPLIPYGTKAGIKKLDREDYVNGDMVQTDREGNVVSGLRIDRNDGQDCVIYAPAASMTSKRED